MAAPLGPAVFGPDMWLQRSAKKLLGLFDANETGLRCTIFKSESRL